jgi:hypothetical protein
MQRPDHWAFAVLRAAVISSFECFFGSSIAACVEGERFDEGGWHPIYGESVHSLRFLLTLSYKMSLKADSCVRFSIYSLAALLFNAFLKRSGLGILVLRDGILALWKRTQAL